MNKIVLSALLFVPAMAHAAGGGHGADGVPGIVTYQAINFVLYAALLFFLLRKPIKNFFKGREDSFKQALIKAEAARADAEKKRQEIQERLTKLEATADQSIAQAKAEAEALKNKIIQEAQELSKNLKDEARRTADIEIERAKLELRSDMLHQAVALSQKMLIDKIADNDQKRLQTEFVEKIQVVR